MHRKGNTMSKMISRVVSVILAALLLVSPLTVLAAEELPFVPLEDGFLALTLESDETTVLRGTLITVRVLITENTGFQALAFTPVFSEGLSLSGTPVAGSVAQHTGNFSFTSNGTADLTGLLVSFSVRVSDSAPAGPATVGLNVSNATSAEGDPIYAEVSALQLTVAARPNSISLSATEGTVTLQNKTAVITAIPDPENAYVDEVVWTSDDETIATVASSGEDPLVATVTGIALGTAHITVTVDGTLSATFTLTVSCSHSRRRTSQPRDPDCTNYGTTGDTICRDCGAIVSYGTITPALGHDYQLTGTVAPTCVVPGCTTYTCTRCGETTTEEIPTVPHTPGAWIVDTPATSTQPGSRHKECTVCHTVLETEEIPATGEVSPDEPQIVVESKTAAAGTTFTVTVSVLNNPGFNMLTLKPVFDDGLTQKGVAKGELLSGITVGKKYNLDTGSEDATEDGILLTVTFSTDSELEPGEYLVSFEAQEGTNLEEDDVFFAVVPGVITITDAAPSILWGDANGDGVVSNKDIVRLKNYFANYDEETGLSTVEIFPGADANGDGVVSNKDIVRLKNYFANYDEETGLSTVILGPAS